ncbi:MAG: hypothetical protein IMF05_14200 [Proteobacteria bacterium]|nr:hypothetical protein [Pseudomonadota bacterium]
MLTFSRIIKVIGAILGIGLIHYAFIFEHPETGFYGLMMLALPGILFGRILVRLVFLVIGAIALFSAIGYGEPGAGPYLLLAAPVCINLMLMVLFGVTLLPGRIPLITRFSRFDRLQTTGPEIDRHTRMVTALWTGYFAVIVAATVLLAVAGNFLTASWIVTVGSPAGSATLFLLEHLYRHFRRDMFGQASVFRTLRVIAHPEAWRGMLRDV